MLINNSARPVVSTGTVSLTQNSDIVTGTGTAWLYHAQKYTIFTVNGYNGLYYIEEVLSDTSVRLNRVWENTSVTDVNYLMFYQFGSITDATLHDAIAATLNRAEKSLAVHVFQSHELDDEDVPLDTVGNDGDLGYIFKNDGSILTSWQKLSGEWTNETAIGETDWSQNVNSDIVPDADGTRDLGADATRFAETYTDALEVTNNITVGGTVDGRDIASDGTKLDNIETAADVTDAENVDAAGAVMEADYNANTILAANTDDTPAALSVPEQTLIGRITSGNIDALAATEVRTLLNVEDGATADQTGDEIKALYESEADTNAFTDDDHSKLDSIEASADVTDEANVVAALNGATLTAVTVAAGDKVLVQDVDDTDNLKTVTAQSIADLTPTLTDEQVQDIVGAMFSSNTETRITASYEDSDGTIDLVVDDDLSNYDNSTSGFLTTVDAGDITVTSEARGDILFRGASGWERLAAGTSGQFLKTQSTTGDPVWDTIAGGGDMLASNNLSDVANAATARLNLNAASQTELLNLSLELADVRGDAYGYSDGIRDAFNDETDVDTATSTNESYDSVNDLYTPTTTAATDQVPTMTGSTTSGVTVTADSSSSSREGWNAFDGILASSDLSKIWHSGSNGGVGWLKVDFGSATEIASYKITSSNYASHYENSAPEDWTFEGSNDDSSWTTLDTQTGVAWTSEQTRTYTLSSTANYRYYRLSVSATPGSSNVVIAEMELLNPTTSNNMTLLSNAFTADSAPDSARLLFQIKPIDSITINTDVIGAVSRDGGTTFTNAVLVEKIEYSDGTRLYEAESVDISSQPSSTSMKWKLTTANNKDIECSGVVLQWS